MDKLTKIYIALVILTIFTFSTGYFNFITLTAVGLLLIATFIKGFLVIEYFMDLHEIKGKYRFIPIIWLGTIILFIALGYFL